MSVFTGSITNADILLNDVDIAGRMAELDLGEIGYEEVEHKALGMIMVAKLPSRAVKAVEATAKYEFLEASLKKQVMVPTKTHSLQMHQYVDVSGADGLDLEKSHQLITHVGFRTISTKTGSSKLGENVELEQKWSVVKIIQKVYGEEDPIMVLDLFNGIHTINGQPVWPR